MRCHKKWPFKSQQSYKKISLNWILSWGVSTKNKIIIDMVTHMHEHADKIGPFLLVLSLTTNNGMKTTRQNVFNNSKQYLLAFKKKRLNPIRLMEVIL